MMTDRRWMSVIGGVVLLVGLLTMGGCATDKAPAEAAIGAAETALKSVMNDANAYVPDQARSLQASLAAVKEKFSKGDYTAVIADAKALAERAREVGGAAATKKAELTRTWTAMSAGMPRVVE